MSDIPITSELSNDVDPFLKSLQVSRQALDDFATYANGLRISPQVVLDTTTPIGQFRQMLAQMLSEAQTSGSAITTALTSQLSNVTVTLNTTAAQAQLQSLVSSFQNINLTFSAPTAQAIGTDIGNAAAAAMQAGIAGIVWPAPPGGGGGGGGGGHGGGMGGGLGRGFGARLLLRQTLGWYKEDQKDDEKQLGTGGDESKILEAEIEHRKRHDQALYGIGELGRNIGESIFSPITGAGTTADLEQELRDKKVSESEGKAAEATSQFNQGLSDRYTNATLGTAVERKREKERQKNRDEQKKIDDKYKTDSARIEEDTRQKDKEAESKDSTLGFSFTSTGTSDTDLSFDIESDSHKVQSEKDLNEKVRQGKLNRLDAIRAKDSAKSTAADVAEDLRTQQDEMVENHTAQKMAQAAMMRANGDTRGAERLELEAKIGSATYKSGQQSPEADKAAFLNAAAETKALENKQSLELFQQNQAVGSIEQQANVAKLEMSGNTRGAKDSDFNFKLNERLALLRERGKTDPSAKAQADALEKSIPTLQASHMQDEDRQDRYKAVQSQDRISDIQDSLGASRLRAAGNNQGASNKEFEDHLDEQIRKLNEAGDAEKDATTKAQDYAEAQAHAAAKTELLANHIAEQTRALKDQMTEIESATAVTNLKNEGRNLDASKKQITDGAQPAIDKARREGHEDLAKDLEAKRDAELRGVDKKNDLSATDLTEEARVKRMENSGNSYGAGLQKIEDKYSKESRDAVGNQPLLDALKANKTEDIYSFMKSTWGKGEADHGYSKVMQDSLTAAGFHSGALPRPSNMHLDPHKDDPVYHNSGLQGPHLPTPDRWKNPLTNPNSVQPGHDSWHKQLHADNPDAQGLHASTNSMKHDQMVDKWATVADKFSDVVDKLAANPPVIVGDTSFS